jgi:transposase
VQLRSVIVTAPDELRSQLRRLPLGELLNRCSHFRRSSSRAPPQLATILVLRTLARRIQAATAEAETLEHEILTHVRTLVPELLGEPGVGPIVAAQLIVTWSHHDRIRSEASFARLAGDRQLNRALHTVILHRRHHDPATRDYIARRLAEGKSSRDAVRLLKRYLARHLYRVMQNSTPLTT